MSLENTKEGVDRGTGKRDKANKECVDDLQGAQTWDPGSNPGEHTAELSPWRPGHRCADLSQQPWRGTSPGLLGCASAAEPSPRAAEKALTQAVPSRRCSVLSVSVWLSIVAVSG